MWGNGMVSVRGAGNQLQQGFSATVSREGVMNGLARNGALQGSSRGATAAFVRPFMTSSHNRLQSSRLQEAPSLLRDTQDGAMRAANASTRLAQIEHVQALHREGRLAVAIIHGSANSYFTCLRPGAVLESERLTSPTPPVPVKSATLLPSPDLPNARVSLYTKVTGPWSQAGYGSGPEKKLFFAFDASTAESFTDGDAMTCYGCDEDGVVNYKAAQSHTKVINSVEDLDACMATYDWRGQLNELLVRMDDAALVGMGVIDGTYPGAQGSDYQDLGKMVQTYREAAGSEPPLFTYDPSTNQLATVETHAVAERIDDPELKQQLLTAPKAHGLASRALINELKRGLAGAKKSLVGQGIDLSDAVLDKTGRVLTPAQWGRGAESLNRPQLTEQVLNALDRAGIDPTSSQFGAAYYRLMMQCHVVIRLDIAAQSLNQAAAQSAPTSEAPERVSPQPALLEPIRQDLSLLANLQSPEPMAPNPRTLLRLLPEALRTPEQCRAALAQGAPLKLIPTRFDSQTYVDLVAPVLNRFPRQFKELPEGLAQEKPTHYLALIRRLDQPDASALDTQADCYHEALALVLAKNPKAIRDVDPGRTVSLDQYKEMAAQAYAADHEVFDRIRWHALAQHDEAFCLPIWRDAVLAKPENIRKIPESSKKAIVDLARALIQQAPEQVGVLWPQFWRPNVDRATFEALLQEARSLDPALPEKLPGHLKNQFASVLADH